MRFYDFDQNVANIYSLTEKWLREIDTEKTTAIQEGKYILSESDQNNIDECEDFISRYVTDPNNLTVGKKYFAVSLMGRPLAKLIKIEYSQQPYIYLGKTSNDFIFQNFKGQDFHVPENYKIDDSGFGVVFLTTTVFTAETELDQFLLMLKLQFDKRWHLVEKLK